MRLKHRGAENALKEGGIPTQHRLIKKGHVMDLSKKWVL